MYPDRPHPSLKKRAASAAPSIIDRLRQSVFLRNGDFQSVEIIAEVDLARQARIFVAMVRAVEQVAFVLPHALQLRHDIRIAELGSAACRERVGRTCRSRWEP